MAFFTTSLAASSIAKRQIGVGVARMRVCECSDTASTYSRAVSSGSSVSRKLRPSICGASCASTSACATSSTSTSGSLLLPSPQYSTRLSEWNMPTPQCAGGQPSPMTMPGRKITSGNFLLRCISSSRASHAAFERAYRLRVSMRASSGVLPSITEPSRAESYESIVPV